jgi:hypothetical protein
MFSTKIKICILYSQSISQACWRPKLWNENHTGCSGCKVLTAVIMSSTTIWNVSLSCSPVKVYGLFGGMCYLYLQEWGEVKQLKSKHQSTKKKSSCSFLLAGCLLGLLFDTEDGAEYSSEMLVDHTIRHHIAEDSTLHSTWLHIYSLFTCNFTYLTPSMNKNKVSMTTSKAQWQRYTNP